MDEEEQEQVTRAEEAPPYNQLPAGETRYALFTDGSCRIIGMKRKWKAAVWSPTRQVAQATEGEGGSSQLTELKAVQLALDIAEREKWLKLYLYTDSWMVANALWGWLEKWKKANWQHRGKPIWAADEWKDIATRVDKLPVKVCHIDAHVPKSRANEEHQNNEQIKQEITHAVALGPVRTRPDVKNVLYSAAGNNGLSWNLWQKVPGETRGRPLGFWSRSYRGSEAIYTPTEKEILAAYEGVQDAVEVAQATEGEGGSSQLTELKAVQLALDIAEREKWLKLYLYTDSWMVANALWGWLEKWKKANWQHRGKPIWAADEWKDIATRVDKLPVKVCHIDAHVPKSRANEEHQNNEQVDQAAKIEVSKIDLDWQHKGELFLARWAHDASGHQGRDATYKWA
ncbi:hypothetical protein DUI87_19063 [Hirundo rustica rustica]|uniref:ribonuclease H n=1 Tax=Hirundo rustica rustica TaxID=333673 RepID=A0A3M0JYN9_HIRRU|nr:hypothetical protein DUI87_19063 [Hirundo rustica rustica]